MSFFDIITGGLVKEIGDAIDKNVTSDEERMQLQNDLENIHNRGQEMIMEAQKLVEENITARHAADMASDVKIAKVIRPYTLIGLTVITIAWGAIGLYLLNVPNDEVSAVAASVKDLQFRVWQAMLGLFTTLDLVVFSFYFGGRSLEKVATKVTSVIAGLKLPKAVG